MPTGMRRDCAPFAPALRMPASSSTPTRAGRSRRCSTSFPTPLRSACSSSSNRFRRATTTTSPTSIRRVPIAADESLADGRDLDALARRYQAVNIKLDNTGGLTRALELAREARSKGLVVMVGCMVATSLAMAPALLLAAMAEFVDLDGPLLLETDRRPSLAYHGDTVAPGPGVWG